MTQHQLIEWLRENSSGVYRPAAEAADLIERMRSWIEETGKQHDICNFYILEEVCDGCACSRQINRRSDRYPSNPSTPCPGSPETTPGGRSAAAE